MCKSKQNCTGICNPLGVPCHMHKAIKDGMLSQGPTIKVTTVDAELDKDVATFFEWMGKAPVMTREQFLEGTTPMSPETSAGIEEYLKETRGYDELPPYYDNSKGSLYYIAEQRGWGVRLFDLVKRLERGGKKDPMKQEIEKSIGVLQLWIKELEQ